MIKKPMLRFLIFALFILVACTGSNPIADLKRDLDQYPEYTIVLEDMKEEGNFFTDYYHRYKIVYAEPDADSLIYRSDVQEWQQVSKRFYQDNYNYLGMVLASKTRDGDLAENPYPPGYQYVGNPQYGRWRQDSQGNSFWEFYGKFAFFSYMFGALTRPVYRTGWDDYRDYRRTGRPYFGRNRQYGTGGSYTKTTHRSFFQRAKAREAARKSRFSRRVNQRKSRSGMSGFRRRSGGFGK